MARTYNTIDADGHILEPLDLWDKYIDPEYRERRPRFTIDENGKERLKVEGKMLGNPRGIGSLGSVGVRQGAVKPDTLKYAEGKKGGFDPHARIVDMDADGIDAAFLYPSLGLFAGAVLVHTGWDRHWRTDRYFEDHPFLTAAAAAFLRDQGALLVGIDSLNIDDIADMTRPVHSILLGAGIPIVEHLTCLDALPDKGFRFSAVPPKVSGMGTFPVRALARLDP